MAKKGAKKRKRWPRFSRPKQPARPLAHHLDSFSVNQIRHWEAQKNARIDFEWQYHNALAQQRAKIADELKGALASVANRHEFSKWQRVVTFAYSLNPLSARGSVIVDPGGRFNIGDLDEIRFPKFPALYVAEDRATAYKEKFGLNEERDVASSGLSSGDVTMSETEPISIVSVSGVIHQALDINQIETLVPFTELIKDFALPAEVKALAKRLGLVPPIVASAPKQIQDTLLDPDWRIRPQVYDLPANPQIFGQIAHSAGIEAILYKSRMAETNCLAIYPRNFENSESFVELDGEVPPGLVNRRLDAGTWRSFV